MNQFDNKSILVCGGSGSWGNELISQLLKSNVKEVTSYARNEHRQVKLQRKFNDPRLKIIIGDVRDYGELKHACVGMNIVFYLSAVKHVPICESQPYEAIKTNINGTRNAIRASIEAGVEKFIDVSTDKACLPINTYGMAKAIGEKLTLNASTLNSKTQFMCIRAGNVMGTNGSVIPFWIDQIKRYNKVSITDKKMTRYFITLNQAIKLLFTAIESDINGGLFVMKMPACKILDLAKVLIDYYGNSYTEIELIGNRSGEKLHELLVSEHEAPNAYIYDENYYVILNNKDDINTTKILGKEVAGFKEYSSTTYLMNSFEITDMLNKGGFLV